MQRNIFDLLSKCVDQHSKLPNRQKKKISFHYKYSIFWTVWHKTANFDFFSLFEFLNTRTFELKKFPWDRIFRNFYGLKNTRCTQFFPKGFKSSRNFNENWFFAWNYECLLVPAFQIKPKNLPWSENFYSVNNLYVHFNP